MAQWLHNGTPKAEKICHYPPPEHHFWRVFFSQLLQGPGYRESLFKSKAKQNQPTNQTTTMGTHARHKDSGMLAVKSAKLISELLQREQNSWCMRSSMTGFFYLNTDLSFSWLNTDFVTAMCGFSTQYCHWEEEKRQAGILKKR